MNRATRLRSGALLVAVLILIVGCTSSTTGGPSLATAVSVTVSPSVIDPTTPLPVSSTPPSPSLNTDLPSPSPSVSSGISAEEAADRSAIEAQWVKFWQTYNNIVRTPSDQRIGVLDQVSIDPVKSQILAAAQRFDSEGIDYFGSVVQHPYWPYPVDGQPFAVMRDCQDQSNYGSVWVATGEKRSIGVVNNNLQAGFIKGDDGVWRVRTFDHLADEPC